MSHDFDPGPPPDAAFEVRLSDAQLDEYLRDGFTSVPRITTDEEIEWLAPIYDHIFSVKTDFDLARPVGAEGEDLVPQVLYPEQRFPQLLHTITYRNARAIAGQLLAGSDDQLLTWGHMILKPPHIGGPLPWHQDEAYWDPRFEYRALGCWVPLDPATVESGCMHFVPGSHRGPVCTHGHVNDDPDAHGLEARFDDQAAGELEAVPVPLDPGGATFHHCRTLHMTTPNLGDRARRAWVNEIQCDPVALPESEVPDRPWVRENQEARQREQGVIR